MQNEHLRQLRFQRLDVYRVAKELACRVCRASIRDAELKDQATRAAKSVLLCLSEGLPNEGQGHRRKYFTEAENSLCETVAAVDLAAAISAMDVAEALEVQQLGRRMQSMLRGLAHGRRP